MASNCILNHEATNDLIAWANEQRQQASTAFEAVSKIAKRLGAHYVNGRTEVGFWVPEMIQHNIPNSDIYLEVYSPLETIDFRADYQTLLFQRERLSLVPDGEYLWGVVEGMRPGRREQAGSFYQIVYKANDGEWRIVPDYLAYSLPFGAFAPAELYDMHRIHADRADHNYFSELDFDSEFEQDGIRRVATPANILQIHVNTASAAGTIEGLTQIYTHIAEKLMDGEALTPAEQNYIGYDAVQLMPVHPTIEYETGPRFWQPQHTDESGETVTVSLRRPDMTNWGYDILLSAMCAINPTALGSKRPDEMVDFITTLHNFPHKPIKVIFDIVYGHIDNQALPLLNKRFFAGANMYGQNVNFQDPVIRALLLEMQRRNHDLGIDGVRVDGAQDFKNWDPQTNQMLHDDGYLREMNDIVQECAGVQYRPWMIFEDGRPWPRDDWELASTYREVTKLMPNVFQWGPLTFAHNTPFLFTFWVSKWWRIREITRVGGKWITGCANHDTLRRGTQVPIDARINTYLGDNLPDIFRKAYDNPAAKLFDYAIMPGVPMDFINASMHAPWGFIRNTDDRYGVKVVSEEARFLYWAIDEEIFARPEVFPRLKELGFTDLSELRRFMSTLDDLVRTTSYNLAAIAAMMRVASPPMMGPQPSIESLKRIARAWMDDVHELCNVSHYTERVSSEIAAYNLSVRNFRRSRRWLIDDFRPGDKFDYIYPTDSTVLFYGQRNAPDHGESIFFIANVEGATRKITPKDLLADNIDAKNWEIALQTPGLVVKNIHQPITLKDSEGVVFIST